MIMSMAKDTHADMVDAITDYIIGHDVNRLYCISREPHGHEAWKSEMVERLYGIPAPHCFYTLDASKKPQIVGNIQVISNEVTEAVNTLSTNALEVIDFINSAVLADYDAFVETSDKYENTAVLMDDILEKFNDKADNLNDIMEKMADSVEAITDSVKESTQAIGLSAANYTEIVGEIQGISEAMEENNKVTEQLNNSTKRFENL